MVSRVIFGLPVIGAVLWAQQAPPPNPQQLWVTAPPPAPVQLVSAVLTGATGSTSYCYFVVGRYPIGVALPGGPLCVLNGPAALTGSNFITVTWLAPQPSMTFDVIRLPSATFPASGTCTSCAVTASPTSSNSFVDQGGATANYTLGATATNASAALTLNNQSASEAQLQIQLPAGSFTLGSKGPSQIGAGAPTGPCTPNGRFYTDSNPPNPLYECVAAAWVPVSSSGGSTTNQFSLFTPTRTDATHVQAGASCTTATPCVIRNGNVTRSFTGGPYIATLLATGSTGNLRFYMTRAGN